jgi:hypothetical protein
MVLLNRMIDLKPKGMTVVVPLADLVDMIQVAAKRQSFGDALDAEGFKPVSGTVALPEGPYGTWREHGKMSHEIVGGSSVTSETPPTTRFGPSASLACSGLRLATSSDAVASSSFRIEAKSRA